MIFCTKLYLDKTKKMFQGHFLRIRTSDLSKTWSETWDSCFESLKGSVVSRKIIVIYYLFIVFKALRLAAVVFMCFLIWPPPRDLSIARLLQFDFKLVKFHTIIQN